ncbi:multicopper oxidase family protein [Streptomyces sp. NPDC101062]|uniref:multicopper oxidase family protein n=1 Tax=unclassified Streptomyces TaxID=2593676 RepID=UPI00380A7BB9
MSETIIGAPENGAVTGTSTAAQPHAAAESGGLTPFLDRLRVPQTLRPGSGPERIELKSTWVRLHAQMAPTHVFAYNGQFPGPTIEVDSGQRVHIAWTNRIKNAPYPVAAGEAPTVNGSAVPYAPPGRGDGFVEIKEVADLPAWSVTHLHGAETGGGNDGWAENAVAYKDAQLSEYPNEQPATTLWYHDHGMNITRWNVFAGLVGMYLIRDEEEAALHLPSGKYEVPLILTDRNFETDGRGRPTGQLLHKVRRAADAPNAESGKYVTLPFTGPYNLVNGVVWPYLDVEPRWYRFRLLNASNARIYNLALVDEENRPVRGAIRQIGSDGGLLPRPVPVEYDETALRGLSIAPAERMDLLIDFRALRGRKVRLVNVGGQPAGLPDPARDVLFPQVMEFRVGALPVADRFVLPSVISSSFRRLTHDTPHGHRLVVLSAPGTKGGAGHPEIWEMVEVTDGSAAPGQDGVIALLGEGESVPKIYRRISRTFDDALGFKVAHGDYELWSLLNLGGPTHPMHIHLSEFQVLEREVYDVTGFSPGGATTTSPIRYTGANPVPDNEQGWKDVFQVRRGEMVKVMGQFTGAHGRFMYHCHLLEHEDMGMMRPFTVMPREVLVFDHHQPGHGGH